MIKNLKIDENTILSNVYPKMINPDTNEEEWIVSQNLKDWIDMAVDTFTWLIADDIRKTFGGNNSKLSASNSKALVLHAKIIDQLLQANNKTINDLNLTDLEKSAFQKEIALAQDGYSDSELLNNALDLVVDRITKYTQLATQASQCQSIEEVVALLESV